MKRRISIAPCPEAAPVGNTDGLARDGMDKEDADDPDFTPEEDAEEEEMEHDPDVTPAPAVVCKAAPGDSVTPVTSLRSLDLPGPCNASPAEEHAHGQFEGDAKEEPAVESSGAPGTSTLPGPLPGDSATDAPEESSPQAERNHGSPG